MKRISAFVIIAFLAGLGIGYFARRALGRPHGTDTRAADLAAIEKFHQEDIKVTLSRDLKGLADVWNENGCASIRDARLW
jgi:hypothetical protein